MILSVCILITSHNHEITWFSSMAVRCGLSRRRSGVLWLLYGPSMARPMGAVSVLWRVLWEVLWGLWAVYGTFYGAFYGGLCLWPMDPWWGFYGRSMVRAVDRRCRLLSAVYGPFYGPSMEAPGGASIGLLSAFYGAFGRSMGPSVPRVLCADPLPGEQNTHDLLDPDGNVGDEQLLL